MFTDRAGTNVATMQQGAREGQTGQGCWQKNDLLMQLLMLRGCVYLLWHLYTSICHHLAVTDVTDVTDRGQ